MVKIYDKTGKNRRFLKEVKVNNKISDEKLNGILDYFNHTLEVISEDAQKGILNQFDTNKVYNTLSDFCVEFCLARVREFKKGLLSSCSEQDMNQYVKAFVDKMKLDLMNKLEVVAEEKDRFSFYVEYCKNMIDFGSYTEDMLRFYDKMQEHLWSLHRKYANSVK